MNTQKNKPSVSSESNAPDSENEEIDSSIAFSAIIKSLILTKISLSVESLLKYSTVTVLVFIILLYLIPNQILIILLAVILVFLCLFRIILTAAADCKPVVSNRVFNSAKVQQYMKNRK